MSKLLFWACCSLLLYVYVLYPLAVRTLGVLLRTPATVRDDGAREPSIRSLDVLIRERHFLNPLKYGSLAWRLWWQVLHYASPLLLLGAFAANVVLVFQSSYSHDAVFYLPLLLAQIAALSAAAVTFILRDERQPFATRLRAFVERTVEWIRAPQTWIVAALIAYLVLRHLTAASDAATSHQRSHHHYASAPASNTASERPARERLDR